MEVKKMTFKEMYKRFENETDVCKFQQECGLRFLLVRSLDKPDLKELIKKYQNEDVLLNDFVALTENAYKLSCSDKDIIDFIKSKKKKLLDFRKQEIEGLDGVLDVLPIVNCGVRNDKVDDIIKRFVRNKTLKTKNALYKNLDETVLPCIRQYCLWSYFNQTSNDIIETLFLEHDAVVPTLRKIHDVDFFVKVGNDYIPFDLKITHVSDDYFELLSKGLSEGTNNDDYVVNENGVSELCKIKDFYKNWKKTSRKELPNMSGLSKNDFVNLIAGSKAECCIDFIEQIKKERKSLVCETIENLKKLEWWNYKYQGERLFCNNNRIFLFLSFKNEFGDARELKSDVKSIRKIVEQLMGKIDKLSVHDIKYVYEKDERYNASYFAKSLSAIYCK